MKMLLDNSHLVVVSPKKIFYQFEILFFVFYKFHVHVVVDF